MTLGILLFTAYILSEFYLFNDKIPSNEGKIKFKNLLSKTLTYSALLLIILLLDYSSFLLISIIVLGMSYPIISIVTKLIKPKYFYFSYLFNILIIIILMFFLRDMEYNGKLINYLSQNDKYIIRLTLGILLICRPSNIILKKFFVQYKPETTEDTLKNAGATIGILERVLIFICLVNELFSAVGLILTAKSIARYNRISNDKAFSEYYLIGTLSSVLITIILYALTFKIFN